MSVDIETTQLFIASVTSSYLNQKLINVYALHNF